MLYLPKYGEMSLVTLVWLYPDLEMQQDRKKYISPKPFPTLRGATIHPPIFKLSSPCHLAALPQTQKENKLVQKDTTDGGGRNRKLGVLKEEKHVVVEEL